MRISAFNRSCERKQSRIYPSRSLKKVTIRFDDEPILFSAANPADEVFGRRNRIRRRGSHRCRDFLQLDEAPMRKDLKFPGVTTIRRLRAPDGQAGHAFVTRQ